MKHIPLLILLVAGCTSEGALSQSGEITKPIGVGAGSDTNPDPDPAVSASCTLPEGPQHAYSTVSDFNALATGAWVRCAGPKIFPNEQAGIEFDADGTYSLLADDGHGGFTKLTGFGNQGTWDGSQESATWVQWNIHATPSSGTGGTPTFEDSPRRFAMETVTNHEVSIYMIATP